MKAWRITVNGMSGVFVAETRGRAKTLAARSIADTGWMSMGDAYRRMRCVRAPEHDVTAEIMGREGGFNG